MRDSKTLEDYFTEEDIDYLYEPMKIVNAKRTMPRNKEKKDWGRRKLYDINKAVIHQSFTPAENSTFYKIAERHIKPGPDNPIHVNGCYNIAYHYGIHLDGLVYQFNPPSSMPHHTHGASYNAIGILVLGDFDGITYDGVDGEPTHEQYRSLAKLLKHLTISGEKFTFNKEEIYGHYHFGRENDPGRALLNFIEDFKNFDFKQENEDEDST